MNEYNPNKVNNHTNSCEIHPELKKYINQYFKEYHIKDCLVVLPVNITEGISQLITNNTETTPWYIIKHISSTPSTEGLCINIVPDVTLDSSNIDAANTNTTLEREKLGDDKLHELIGEYMSRLATLVEQSTSREHKPAAVWKHRNFLSSISHQIKTPLSAIFSGTKLIKHYTNNEYIDRICEYMNQSCVELTRYMNDIIDFYYLKQGVFVLDNTNVSLCDTIDYVYENYKLQMQDAEILFVKSIAPDVPAMITCDELRLTQILMNLMDNAVKFTCHPDVDNDMIANQLSSGTSHRMISIQISTVQDNESTNVIIRVLDNGMGQIDLDNQENYFQPFNQTTRNWLNAPDGIGLGLCLSRDLARKMGGDLKFVAPIAFPIANDSPKSVISIKSKTCIELTLPYANTLNATLKKTHPVVSINTESNDEPFSNPKLADELVLIDDNQTNLELLTLILEQLGHKNIKSFTNCLIGQKYITDNALNISHAFIDIRMPRKNGFDLISEIASVCTNTHFILLTALRHDDIRDRFTFITSQNPNIKISLLFKPIDCNELKKILTKPVKEAIPPTTQLGQKRSMRVTFI